MAGFLGRRTRRFGFVLSVASAVALGVAGTVLVPGAASAAPKDEIPGGSAIYAADAGNGRVVEVGAGGAQAVIPATGLQQPVAVAVDAQGDLFIADAGTQQVLEESSAGQRMVTSGLEGLDDPTGTLGSATEGHSSPRRYSGPRRSWIVSRQPGSAGSCM